MTPRGNLLGSLPDASGEEVFETLLKHDGLEIERIVSHGQASPPGFWYDQERHEWVLVLQGEAGLEIEREDEILHLRAGDWVEIPARRRHRVDWTSSEGPTVWLALHYR